jgi:AcrR family transcriptional regulator
MPARKRKRTKRNVAEAVRAMTLALVEEVGIDGVNMRTIAKRVGVTHVALYRHIASKEALLATIAEQGFGMLRAIRRGRCRGRRGLGWE